MYSPPPAGPPTHGYPPPGSAYPAGYAVQGYPPPTAYPHGAYVYPPPPQGYGYPPPGYGYPPPAHPAEGQPCYGAPPAGYPPAAPGYAYVVPAPVYGAPPALMDSRAASPRRHLVSRSRSRSRSRGARQRGNNQNNHGSRRRRRGRSVEKGNVNGGGSYGDAESNLTLEEVLPKATTYAMQQEGSRFLQTVMGGENLEDRQKVMEALLPEVAKLSKDAFGNFIVQKMLENADAWDHQSDLVKRLEGEVLNLASDKFGCRVIQKAMEVLPHEHQETLAGELKTNVQECIENMNGNHVVQKCVQCMRSEAVDFIVQAVQSRIAEISMHSFGCRVVQRLLESCSSSQLERVLDRLTACVSKLARDNHGNYVVQSALDHGRPADKAKIIAAIRRDIVGFGKNKCSSNVVEKCIKVAAAGGSPELEQEYRGLVVALLGDESSSGGGALKDLVHDKFGNYTVQCMIKHSEGPDRDLLRRRIEGMASELRSSTTGKHILSTMKKEFGPSFEGDD